MVDDGGYFTDDAFSADVETDFGDPASLELTVDGALALAKVLNVEFPLVLALYPAPYEPEQAARVEAEALDRLRAEGVLIGEDEVDATVAQWFRTIGRPDVSVEARIIEPPQMLRLVIARSRNDHAMIARLGDSVVVQPIDGARTVKDMVCAPLLAALGDVAPADLTAMSAPRAQFAQIAKSRRPGDSVSALEALGASVDTAEILNEATASPIRSAEIIATEFFDGGVITSDGGAGVLDGEAGRIVAVPHATSDGEIWTTFGPGSAQRFELAIDELVRMLPSQSWFDSTRTTPITEARSAVHRTT